MVGKQQAAAASALFRPREWRLLELEPAREDLVDTFDRRRERRDFELPEIEVAAKNTPLRTREELGRQHDLVVDGSRVEVSDDELPASRRDLERLANAAMLPLEHTLAPRQVWIEHECPVLTDLEARVDENRVRLAGRHGAKPNRVERGYKPRERTEQRGHRLGRACSHPAPLLEPPQGPERNFLESHDVGCVAGDETDHALEVRASARRKGSPVKDVPGTDEQSQSRTSLGRVRGRFADVIERQLDLFLNEHAGLINDTEAALRAYNDASRDEAEERYGDFLDLVETGTDELTSMRDAYAGSLDEDSAEEYRELFNRLVRKRLPRFGLEV
jgi:hypothetical protein